MPRGRKVYKYALTAVDLASRNKEAEPMTSKDSAEVATAMSIFLQAWSVEVATYLAC